MLPLLVDHVHMKLVARVEAEHGPLSESEYDDLRALAFEAVNTSYQEGLRVRCQECRKLMSMVRTFPKITIEDIQNEIDRLNLNRDRAIERERMRTNARIQSSSPDVADGEYTVPRSKLGFASLLFGRIFGRRNR